MNARVADVVARVSDAAFGRPLVMNVLRGLVVEAIVATALEPEWAWCSTDYASWDFQRSDGLRLEVKQSARRQSWPAQGIKPPRPCFDVRSRTGHWDDDGRWIAMPGRSAHLYLFCYHDRMDAGADHRDPDQWTFFVVRTSSLPPAKTIGLTAVRALADGVSIERLRETVDGIASSTSLTLDVS